MLGSYRSGEQKSPALRAFAAAVRRHDVDTEIALRPLADSAVAELVKQLVNEPVRADLLAGVTRRARGIPLFVRALMQSTTRLQGPPAVVRDVVLGQLDRLDPPARGLLNVVAVASETSPEVLAAVWPGELEGPLRDLVGHGLLTEQVTGRSVRVRVAHPLYAEVAYAELTAADRRRLHARLADAIEKLTPADTLALAPHYLEAGDAIDSNRAPDVLGTAGERALSIHAIEEAVRYFRAALAGAEPSTDINRRMELLTGLGRALQENGKLTDAASVWSEALALAQRAGLAAQHASLRYRLALLETERGNLSLAEQHSRAGAEVARPDAGDAQALALRLVYSMRSGDESRMRAAADHTAALAAPSIRRRPYKPRHTSAAACRPG
ncbi:ATP-binding protein [Fodinicola feengrottensis]|uniref:hypothetical protein n=1 Tax=Fodinicola feengrottensis TaxID=435914 RepID=UPI0013D63225|nr:hypothetical protein [Fodinicola feengrottensis]